MLWLCTYIHTVLTNLPFSTIQCNYSVVDGGWSSWTEGSCSETCIRIDTRTCNNPTPYCGGLPCEGSSTHEEPCSPGL